MSIIFGDLWWLGCLSSSLVVNQNAPRNWLSFVIIRLWTFFLFKIGVSVFSRVFFLARSVLWATTEIRRKTNICRLSIGFFSSISELVWIYWRLFRAQPCERVSAISRANAGEENQLHCPTIAKSLARPKWDAKSEFNKPFPLIYVALLDNYYADLQIMINHD